MKTIRMAGSIVFCLFLFSFSAAANGAGGHVALVMKALSNPFFLAMRDGATEYAEANGIDLDVNGIELETDVDYQINLVDGLIRRRVDAIVLTPADSERLVPVVKRALDSGIKVINIDNPLDARAMADHGIAVPFVGSDNFAGAKMVGDYLRSRMEAGTEVAIIEGIRGVENAELRRKGFLAALEGGGFELVASETGNWHGDEAYAAAQKILSARPDLGAFLVANDAMALGVLNALWNVGRAGKVLVGSYDNIEAVREEIREGNIHASMEQHPELMGWHGVRLAHMALMGSTPPERFTTDLDLVSFETFGKRLCLGISNLAYPYFRSLETAVQRAAEINGMDFTVRNADEREALQLTQVGDMIEGGCDAILVNPVNAGSLSPGLEMAISANIPVVTVDRVVAEGLADAQVASDNVEGGRMAGSFFARVMPEWGKIVEIEGIPGTSTAYDRGKGFNEAINATDRNLVIAYRRIAYFDRERAAAEIRYLIASGVRFDAVFAHNDAMALGALDAIDAAHLDPHPVVVGFDGIPEAVQKVESGVMAATVVQRPKRMGRLAVQAVAGLMRGDVPPRFIPVPLDLLVH